MNFKYTKNGKDVIKNISFTVKKGEKIGIVGTTGSGKSTLLDLFMGLNKPLKGNIFVDGEDINDKKNISKLKSWHQSISHVPQKMYFTNATIAENIAFGVKLEDIDFQQINKVIKLSNLDDTVSKLTNGVNTIIGEQGVQLSGGQRQRIAIARALYQDPNILVFDEATSALDGLTEKSIMQSIKALSKTKTIILIAHRLNTVKDCNQIFLFNNGKLVDSGSYEELKNSNSEFHKMIDNA